MKELVFVNNNNEVVTDSLMVAEVFGKRHSAVLRDIDVLIGREKEFKENVTETTYTNGRGKYYRKFLLTRVARERLANRYKYRAMSKSPEKTFGETLKGLFKDGVIEKQKQIGKYRVDWLFDGCIVIEHDAQYHQYNKEYDEVREKEITDMLFNEILNDPANGHLKDKNKGDYVKFLRVKEGEEVDGIRRLLLMIEDMTWSSPTNFLKQ